MIHRLSQRDRLLATLEELGAPWRDREDLPDGEAYARAVRAGPGIGSVGATPSQLGSGSDSLSDARSPGRRRR